MVWFAKAQGRYVSWQIGVRKMKCFPGHMFFTITFRHIQKDQASSETPLLQDTIAYEESAHSWSGRGFRPTYFSRPMEPHMEILEILGAR